MGRPQRRGGRGEIATAAVLLLAKASAPEHCSSRLTFFMIYFPEINAPAQQAARLAPNLSRRSKGMGATKAQAFVLTLGASAG
jgi:hypothetical protein